VTMTTLPLTRGPAEGSLAIVGIRGMFSNEPGSFRGTESCSDNCASRLFGADVIIADCILGRGDEEDLDGK